jgi:hypothetical protein
MHSLAWLTVPARQAPPQMSYFMRCPASSPHLRPFNSGFRKALLFFFFFRGLHLHRSGNAGLWIMPILILAGVEPIRNLAG